MELLVCDTGSTRTSSSGICCSMFNLNFELHAHTQICYVYVYMDVLQYVCARVDFDCSGLVYMYELEISKAVLCLLFLNV